MKFKNAPVALTAFSVFAAPLAAHADTTGKISNVSDMGARQSTAVRGEHKADSAIIALAAVGAAAAGYGIYKAVDGDKSKGS